MIPDEIIVLPGERLAKRGASSLPVTGDLEDPDNFDIASFFLFLLHEGKCHEKSPRRQPIDDRRCIETCMFLRLPRLRQCADHYANCCGEDCTEPHCKQSVRLYEHWKICFHPFCFICSSTVNLIMENFCSFLGEKGNKYTTIIAQIKVANLATRKTIIKSIVSISEF